jgi:hypothetical protein
MIALHFCDSPCICMQWMGCARSRTDIHTHIHTCARTSASTYVHAHAHTHTHAHVLTFVRGMTGINPQRQNNTKMVDARPRLGSFEDYWGVHAGPALPPPHPAPAPASSPTLPAATSPPSTASAAPGPVHFRVGAFAAPPGALRGVDPSRPAWAQGVVRGEEGHPSPHGLHAEVGLAVFSGAASPSGPTAGGVDPARVQVQGVGCVCVCAWSSFVHHFYPEAQGPFPPHPASAPPTPVCSVLACNCSAPRGEVGGYSWGAQLACGCVSLRV